MATITSPRIPPSPTSSIRSSLSIDRSSSTAPATGSQPTTRRARSALRDYYNLPAPAASTSATSTSAATSTPSSPNREDPSTTDEISPLDAPNFSAPEHVQHLLQTASLGDVLRTEARLLGEIRGLDGEKKALVYDNYSKLIAATDTIGRMREEMEPLGGVLGRLGGMVEGIVESAGALAESKDADGLGKGEEADKAAQMRTVRWVLDAPERLGKMVVAGRKEDAEKEWVDVQLLLEKWEGVGGVEETRAKCKTALAGD